MGDIYLEVTDLVMSVMAYGTVTGIQRVQERILHELAAARSMGNVWCLSRDVTRSGYRACRLEDLYALSSGDLADRFRVLAGETSSGRWPTRMEIRRHLNRGDVRGWQRAVRKAEIYSRAVLSPASLRRQGILRQHSEAVEAVYLERLPVASTLVLLGAGWDDPRVSAVAARHARAGGEVVQCIYDLIPLKHPEYFCARLQQAFHSHFDRTIDSVSRFICISEHTRQDLEDVMAAKGRTIPSLVMPLAHEFAGYARNARGCLPTNTALNDFGRPGREFMLCVGTLEIRKNGLSLLQAWQRLKPLLGEATPHLVFCGRRGWKAQPFFSLLQSDAWLRSRVHLIPTPSDADIAFLHERSLSSIYPSLYEGWGLPVGEAAWFGRTCITSRESSLPEVCGMLADYVDPRDPDEIADRVRRVVEDRSRLAMREDLIRQAPLRTWGDVAARFIHAISKEAAIATTQRDAGPYLPLRQAA